MSFNKPSILMNIQSYICAMARYFVFPIISFLALACHKDLPGEISVTTSSVTRITDNSAQSGGTVSFTGGFTIGECGICYSTSSYPDYDDSRITSNYGKGAFSSSLTNLNSGTTYYIRAYANTSSGIKYGNQVQFKTTETILSYGSGTFKKSWGLINGGTDERAVMFPTTMLTKYSGMKVQRIKIYTKSKRSVTLKIYRGGTNKPSTLVVSKTVSLSSIGWNTIDSFTPFTLNTSQNLWVSFGCSYSAGDYPYAASEGINNKNARWSKNSSGNWYDVYDNNENRDLCWMIQAVLGNETRSATLRYVPQQEDSMLVSEDNSLGSMVSDKTDCDNNISSNY